MRFSGVLVDEGIRLLERSLLPACQKTGKKVFLLLSSNDVFLVQDETEAQGMHVVAGIKAHILFDEHLYVCKSKMDDVICLRVSLDVLLKSLRSASAHEAEKLQIALRHRPLKAFSNGTAVPLIEICWNNESMNISQEIPIEKPCPSSEVTRIRGLCSQDATCNFYLDIAPELKAVMGILENLKIFSKTAVVCLTMDGDFHVISESELSKIGVGFPSFDVFGSDGSATQNPKGTQQHVSIEERLAEAKRQERAYFMEIKVTHLYQVLRSAQLTSPARVLCGMAEDFSHVHIVLSYNDILDNAKVSTDRSFDFKIPNLLENE